MHAARSAVAMIENFIVGTCRRRFVEKTFCSRTRKQQQCRQYTVGSVKPPASGRTKCTYFCAATMLHSEVGFGALVLLGKRNVGGKRIFGGLFVDATGLLLPSSIE